MANRQHELLVCGAVISQMVRRKGACTSDVSAVQDPERDKGAQSPVDLKFCIGSTEYVMEHTEIENFPGQIQDACRINKLLRLVVEKLRGRLPPEGHFELAVAPGAVEGAKDTERIQEALVGWILEKAPRLEIWPHRTSNYFIKEAPPGVPFVVKLTRAQYDYPELMIARCQPKDMAQ